MHPLLHSPFLQALGYAIINSLWQFALLWLLYFAMNTIFKLSSHQRYITGLVLEFAGFVWFLETLHFYYNQSLLFAQNTSFDQVSLSSLANSSGTIRERVFLLVLRSEQFFPYLSIAYLALLFILTVRWLYAYTYTQKVRTEGLREIEVGWQRFVQTLSIQLRIKRRVDIFLSELVQTPLTIGFFKPLILIPVATINYLTPQQLEAVILHELAHIKRFDYLFNLLLAFIEACLFFNPFMQLIHQQVKKERENCCDDWVLKYKYSAASYAQALLQIASHQTRLPLLALKATDNKKLLINRIKRIIEKNERSFFNYKHQLLALLVITTVLSSLSFLSPSKKIVKVTSSADSKKVIYEPIAAKVDNPLFNPVFFLTNSSRIEPEQKKKTPETKSVKGSIPLNRLLTPVEPPLPLDPGPFVEDENGNVVEEAPPVSLAEVMPSVVDNRMITIEKNNLKGLDRSVYTRNAPGSLRSISTSAETIQRRFKRFGLEANKENKVDLPRVAIQLKKALEEIKVAGERGELAKLQGLVRTGIRTIERERVNGTKTGFELKIDKLELLEKQIEKAIDSMQLSKFFTTASNSDLNINFEMPAVVYTIAPGEKQHPFSYEYFAAPRVKIVDAAKTTNCTKAKNKKQKAVVYNEDENNQDEIVAPPPPSRSRAVYVIKI